MFGWRGSRDFSAHRYFYAQAALPDVALGGSEWCEPRHPDVALGGSANSNGGGTP